MACREIALIFGSGSMRNGMVAEAVDSHIAFIWDLRRVCRWTRLGDFKERRPWCAVECGTPMFENFDGNSNERIETGPATSTHACKPRDAFVHY